MKLPVREFDAVMIGTGGVGMRAALQISQSDQACVLLSRVFPTRSHTVSVQGGITVALGNTHEGNWEWHMYDAVRGSDYTDDQDAIEYICKTGPEATLELEHMGLPFSRLNDGRIYQRPFDGQPKNFGGEQAAHTVATADHTDHALLHMLYQQNLKSHITIFSEQYALDPAKNQDGAVVGYTVLCIETGEVVYFETRATVLAVSGAERIYQSIISTHTNTSDDVGMAIRTSASVQDIEMWQFHLTGIAGADMLVTEGCRGEGGYLLDKHGECFMGHYASNAKDLTGRDVVACSIMIEIREGRSCDGPWGSHAKLKFDHLDKEVLKSRLPSILELFRTSVHADPAKELTPVIPACHYMMGGIPTRVTGQTLTVNERGEDVVVPGPFTVGEIACVSVHGTNRLDGNSLLDLVVFGHAVGLHLRESTAEQGASRDTNESGVEALLDRLDRWNDNRNGGDPAVVHKALQECIQHNFLVSHKGDAMAKGLGQLKVIRECPRNTRLDDTSNEFNIQRAECLELDNLIETAYVMAVSANSRTESRSAHSRFDFPDRDDENWLCHSLYLPESESMTRRSVNTESKLRPAPPPKIRTY